MITREDVTELGDVLTGKAPGRQSADDITIFDSTGLAMHDLGIALAAMERADELDLPTIELQNGSTIAAATRLWRAGIISKALFWAGVAAVLLVLLGGTTWASNGIWAPDGVYSRFISPIIGLAWITVISGLLVTRGPSTARAAERREVPAT